MAAMDPPSPRCPPTLRQWVLLAEHQRLRAKWRCPSAAADGTDGCQGSDVNGLEHVLHLRLLAAKLQAAAMKLLRDAPI